MKEQQMTDHNEKAIANARMIQLKEWIEKNKKLFSLSKALKIEISIKDLSVKGNVTNFPDS